MVFAEFFAPLAVPRAGFLFSGLLSSIVVVQVQGHDRLEHDVFSLEED